MRIERVTWRYKNDFHWLGRCEHCGVATQFGDGYADEYYCLVVVPNRACPECGKSTMGELKHAKQST